MKKPFAFLIISLAFPLQAFAQAQESSAQYEIVEPPSCINDLGETVEFRERQSDRLQVAAGMANRDGNRTPFVLRVNYGFSPPQFQRFIDFHECAHHQTGDVDRPHPPRNSQAHLLNESISDCIAIMRLRDEDGYNNAQVEEVVAAMRNDMSKIGFPEISISSRISNTQNCYKRAGSFDAYIEEVKTRKAREQ